MEVIRESRYADLIVIDAGTSFTEAREGTPTGFVREVLKLAECPVIIAPESFEGIDEIIFTYDNSRAAAFAIKQFAQLFPGLRDRKAVVLSVIPPGKNFTDKYQLKEWLKAHYEAPELVIVNDHNVRARLLEYLLSRRHAFVIMGAYGRNMLSNLISPSHANAVVNNVMHPIFITHD
jgi:hypothetical protein